MEMVVAMVVVMTVVVVMVVMGDVGIPRPMSSTVVRMSGRRTNDGRRREESEG